MNNEFTEPINELKRVAEEINLLRQDIQTASAALGRIERRLKASFPNYPNKEKQPKERKKIERTHSLKTSQQLKSFFEDLVTCTQTGGESAYLAKINELSDEDIIALAVEVGIGSSSRQSRQKAKEGVRKRIQEAMQLQFVKKKNT
jgi:hypothetical protein